MLNYTVCCLLLHLVALSLIVVSLIAIAGYQDCFTPPICYKPFLFVPFFHDKSLLGMDHFLMDQPLKGFYKIPFKTISIQNLK